MMLYPARERYLSLFFAGLYAGFIALLLFLRVPSAPVMAPAIDGTSQSGAVSFPVRLRIPALTIDAPVRAVGLTDEGAMNVPKSPQEIAWYALGVRPGVKGNAVFAAHLDSPTGGRGVFWNLDALQDGDRIEVDMDNGKTIAFRVQDRSVYRWNLAPMEEIFGYAEEPRLRLITCSGYWQGETYSERLVITAQLE